MKNPHKVFRCCVALAAFGGGLALASDISDPPPPVYQAPPPPIVNQPTPPPPVSAPARVTAPAVAPANPAPGAPLPPKRSAAELEKLVAPMALYPDPLVAAMLPAAAYPIEVVLAARFVKDTNNLTKINEQPWDDSVKAVARFPEVIQQMNDNVAWTVELGQAFVVQQKDVMDAVQTMRAKAQAAGTLTTTPEQVVVVTNVVVQQADASGVLYVTNQVVQILPGASEVIYVPHYDPAVVYWPPPYYYYDPFWHYYDPFWPCVSFGFGLWWGSAYWGHCNWHGGWVAVGHPSPYPPYHYPPPPGPGHPPPPGPGHPPPGGGPVPPGGGPLPPGTKPLPPGPGQPANAAANTAAARPWQPDANRLRSAGTRGSLASVQARDPSAAQFASSGTSSRAVSAAGIGTRPGSRSGIDGSPTVATSPRASRSTTSAGVAPAEASVSRSSPRTPATGASRSSPPGASVGRASGSSGVTRATAAPNYSRSAPRLSSPSQVSSFVRTAPPSYRGAAPSGGMSRAAGGGSFSSAGPVSRGGGGGSFSSAGSVSRGGGGGPAPSGGFSGRGSGGYSGGGFSSRGGGGGGGFSGGGSRGGGGGGFGGGRR